MTSTHHPSGPVVGKPLLGLAACVFRSFEILSVARHSGFDFLVADMEHGALSLADAAALSVMGRECGYPVHVRVPGAKCDDLSRVADCGAAGLIVPHLGSVEEARHVVARLRFPPFGARSIPPPIAATGFRPLRPGELVARCCETPMELAVMIESEAGLASVDEIAAVDGIDTILIGANDLAQSLGHLGDLGNENMHAAFRRIAQVASAHGRAFGVMGIPTRLLRSHALDLGASRVVVTNEINLLFDAAQACVATTRALLTASPQSIDPKHTEA
jgi:4-hydroxy-2-oxoheptanedioate aldolase